ncbi:MAG TPA: response regulator [Byssovorax sp.]
MAEEYVVLFVDDEPAILRALARTLKHPRCRFVTTLDPTTALDLIVKERVDVLFSDVDMPQMSGLDLVRAVRDAHPHIVRMMLTAGRSLTTALSAINDGGVLRFMLKPWEDDVIRAALGEALAAVDEVRAGGATRAAAAARADAVASFERRYPGISAPAKAGQHALDHASLSALASNIAPELHDVITAAVRERARPTAPSQPDSLPNSKRRPPRM